MSKEKKVTEIKEEIKNSAQLTDEQMAEVNAGMTPAAATMQIATAKVQLVEAHIN